MAKRFVDLSIALEDGLPSDPPQMIPRIQYMDHKEGAESMRAFFPEIEPEKDLPEGLGWAGPLERIEAFTPTGKPYTLLNLPYFLAGKIQDYIAWLME